MTTDIPDPATIELPNIQYRKPHHAWGRNFTRLDTEPIWDRLTEESRATIHSEKTVRLALQHFALHMQSDTFIIPSLIRFKRTPNHTRVKTLRPLAQRIQLYYSDRSGQGKGSNFRFHIFQRKEFKSTPIQREQCSSYHFWKDKPDSQISGHRYLARAMSQQHNVDPFWMMYGISVSLQMIEALLCQGYVIVIMNQGRFWSRNVTADWRQIRGSEGFRWGKKVPWDCRIVFQAEKDYTFPYKRF